MYRPCIGCEHTECKYSKERDVTNEMNDEHIIDFITDLKGKNIYKKEKLMTNFEKLKRLNKRELAKFLVLKTNDGYASPFTVGVYCDTLEKAINKTFERLNDEDNDMYFTLGAI